MERNAIAMLKHRINTLELYLTLVINGDIDITNQGHILRRLESVCRRLALPLGGTECLEVSGSNDCNSAVMLALAARTSIQMSQYISMKQKDKRIRYIPKKKNRNQYF